MGTELSTTGSLKSQSVERFQASPQSLCKTVYKLLSKILATIGLSRSSQSWPNQKAIVKGRHIGEGLIIANETIHSMDRIQESDCLKLDMMKAYDRLEWPFLLSMSGLSPSSTGRPRE